MKLDLVLKAVSSERRLQILEWLKRPKKHFPPQVDGDLTKDGVCGCSIADKLGVSQATASEHLRILSQSGLISGKRIKQWTFYQRDEKGIAGLKARILKTL
jgi:DNA-binding transcriptional ArsR family regulator